MKRFLRRLTRFWCAHEYVEHTRKGHVTFECMGCGKHLKQADVPPNERRRLEALARMGTTRRSA